MNQKLYHLFNYARLEIDSVISEYMDILGVMGRADKNKFLEWYNQLDNMISNVKYIIHSPLVEEIQDNLLDVSYSLFNLYGVLHRAEKHMNELKKEFEENGKLSEESLNYCRARSAEYKEFYMLKYGKNSQKNYEYEQEDEL